MILTISCDLTGFDIWTKYFATFFILVIQRSALPIQKWETNLILTISFNMTGFDIWTKYFVTFLILWYSIVKDSSADFGVNFKIVQNRPTVKAVCTKISKKFFCIFVNIFIFLRENKEVPFFIFWIFKLKQP